MTDQVLTDDEKDALLEGVANGEVEVQATDGPRYADVQEYVIGARSRIVTNSYPRLQQLNKTLASSIAKSASKTLNSKIEVAPGSVTTCTYGEFCEQAADRAVIFEFSAKPLDGSAVMYLQTGAVSHVVETFYGGSKENPPRQEAEGFTPGEQNVIALLCEQWLIDVVDVWQSLTPLEAQKLAVHQSTDITEIIETGAAVIACDFDLYFGEDKVCFHIIWPTTLLAPLLPVLEGQKRERDPAEDARWERVFRSRLPLARTRIHTRVGSASMSLRDVAELKPGDIIDIDSPRKGTVFAKDVPVLEGRFGVHDGSYAVETTRWLRAEEDLVQQ